MSVKVTKRTTRNGPRYSISRLTYEQLYRIKCAMIDCEKKMKEIAAELQHPAAKEDFEQFARDAHEVSVAVQHGCC